MKSKILNIKLPKKEKRQIFLLVVFVFMLLFSPKIFAKTADELRDQIQQKNDEIVKLEKEIEEYRKQLTSLGTQTGSLKKSIKELDLTKKKLMADIKVTENKITSANLDIKKLEMQIDEKEEKIGDNKKAIAESLRKINEFDSQSIIEQLLSNEKISDTWNDIDNMNSLQKEISFVINDLNQLKQGLQENKTDTERVRKSLVGLKIDLSDEKKIVEQNTKQKNQLLTETKNKESNYQKLLKQKLVLQEAFEKELQNYEAQLKFVLDPSKLPKTGIGILSWPLDKIIITQRFGNTAAAKRLYASGWHNGMDFGIPVGTPVKSMADGIILGTGDTDVTCKGASFGKWVLIKYNNGLASTYGHLSMIKVSSGEKVTRGQVVGYSGNTGYSTGPHLHVSVYAGEAVTVKTMPSKTCGGRIYTMPISAINAYLDPALYLLK